MNLSSDEKRLLEFFRKLSPTGMDELLAYAATLARRIDTGSPSTSGQCRLNNSESRHQSSPTPIFTE